MAYEAMFATMVYVSYVRLKKLACPTTQCSRDVYVASTLDAHKG
jgi:hypothetical protein